MTDIKKNKEHAFDAYVKKVLRNEVRDIYRKKSRIKKHEVLFSELSKSTFEKIQMYNEPIGFYQEFHYGSFSVLIYDEDLAIAMLQLKVQYLNIILLSYFYELSDIEISKILDIPRSTIQWQRQKALAVLKELLRERGVISYNEIFTSTL